MVLLRNLAVALLGFLIAGSAQATTVDYTGSYVNMGTLDAGTSGTIYTNAGSLVVGTLAANTVIEFEYSILSSSPSAANLNTNAVIAATGSYGFTKSGSYYWGSSTASTTGTSLTEGYINLGNSTPLVLSTASLDSSKRAAITITNLSSALASFNVLMASLPANLRNLVTVSYRVLSAVPLPASFYLFAVALAGMLFVGYRKNARVG